LLVSLIDTYATDKPSSGWASIPKDNDEVAKGFIDITFKQFANATNYAAKWLQANVTSHAAPFETLAYVGPKDLRYLILAAAVLKCGVQVCACKGRS